MRFVLSFLCLTLLACSVATAPPPKAPARLLPRVVWSVSNSFMWTEAGLAAVRDGVGAINRACGREILHEGRGGVVVVQRFAMEDVIGDEENGIVLGLYDSDANTVSLYLPATESPELFHSVVAHEFLHALGESHFDGPPGVSIMAPTVDKQSPGVTRLDIERLGPGWECPSLAAP